MPFARSTLLLPLLSLLLGCSQPAAEPPAREATLDLASLEGAWRAVLTSPGGELPFTLEIDASEGGLGEAWILNGAEQAPASVTVVGAEVEIGFPWYDADIRAHREEDEVLVGTWRRTSGGEDDSTLPFRATRGEAPRFRSLAEVGLEPGSSGLDSPSGTWAVTFVDEDGEGPARAEFRSSGGEEQVTGTFLTPTGDYRFLEGRWQDGLLRLSTFDGAHAFLFHARARDDGSLVGDFWSRDRYHATWTAVPAEETDEILPDAWAGARLTNDEGRMVFTFDDLQGRPVSLDDERFRGRVVLVNVFGSWCPNCNDEAPLLASWHRRWSDAGLEIIGIAYEHTGDLERDRRQVGRFAARHGIEYPLLLGGLSDKTAAAGTLPDLDRILAFPTTIFIGRDGRVRRIHSGFEGPGTGQHHVELVAEMEELIETLLDEAS